ncbi:MAG: hypothetical protein SFW09_12815 [Hyphomicrobiaceae bacterium]|nr:hypothetical protein [Hyphomicrobiaceae bacterium]
MSSRSTLSPLFSLALALLATGATLALTSTDADARRPGGAASAASGVVRINKAVDGKSNEDGAASASEANAGESADNSADASSDNTPKADDSKAAANVDPDDAEPKGDEAENSGSTPEIDKADPKPPAGKAVAARPAAGQKPAKADAGLADAPKADELPAADAAASPPAPRRSGRTKTAVNASSKDLDVPGCAPGMLCTVCVAGCAVGSSGSIVHAGPKPAVRR